jgi:hypothetical protein
MRRALVALAAACAAIGLTACGGTPVKHPPPKPPLRTQAAGHPCNPRDAVMQCYLPASKGPVSNPLSSFSALQGIDFAWGGSAPCTVSQARSFGDSYVSTDSSKNWTRSCIDAYHHAGKATAAVWEAGANDAQGGSSLGASQTRQAISELNALGAGPRQPVVLAIDCDCAGSSLISYFQGANSANGAHPIEAYGGYYQLLYLSQHHLIGHANWQTYAWSSGHWLPASIAPLEQYQNGSQIDLDRAIAPYYGQWPYKPPKPPAPSIRCFHKGWPSPASDKALCLKVRAQDAAQGKQITREQAFLKVSQQNITSLQAKLNPILGKLSAIEKRAASELAKHHFLQLKVSASNAIPLEAQAAPLQTQLATAQSNARTEQSKITSDSATLHASLKKYGW